MWPVVNCGVVRNSGRKPNLKGTPGYLFIQGAQKSTFCGRQTKRGDLALVPATYSFKEPKKGTFCCQEAAASFSIIYFTQWENKMGQKRGKREVGPELARQIQGK